ncbi:MAG: hypothetical protein AAF657_35890 [Acidobacteriota bacterium]
MKKVAVFFVSLVTIYCVPATAAGDSQAPVADDHVRDIMVSRSPNVDGPPVDPADIDAHNGDFYQ